jgi:hypothetical protein
MGISAMVAPPAAAEVRADTAGWETPMDPMEDNLAEAAERAPAPGAAGQGHPAVLSYITECKARALHHAIADWATHPAHPLRLP